MRNKDENKQIAIFNAAIELITRNGFADTSLSKIAHIAKISSSTIYVYFKNKEDMLNKLYLWIKEKSGEYIFKNLDDELPVKDWIQLFWKKAYDYMVLEPVKFSFTEQFANSPIIKKIGKSVGAGYYSRFHGLLNKGIRLNVLKNVPTELLSAFILAPITYLAKQKNSENIKITDESIQNAFILTWDSIKL